jgi:hypothetical protein
MRRTAIVLIALFVSQMAAAADTPSDGAQPVPNLSTNRIRLSTTLSDGKPLKMTLRERSAGRIRRLADNALFEVEGVLSPDHINVTLDISRILERDGSEITIRMGSIVLTRGDSPINLTSGTTIDWDRLSSGANAVRTFTRERAAPLFTSVAFDDVIPAHSSAPPSSTCTQQGLSSRLGDPITNNECNTCCVTCDGTQACGCAVEMGCGSCCCRACC